MERRILICDKCTAECDSTDGHEYSRIEVEFGQPGRDYTHPQAPLALWLCPDCQKELNLQPTRVPHNIAALHRDGFIETLWALICGRT